MSDDEEVLYKKPEKIIQFGSLEKHAEEIQSDEDDYEPESKKPAFAINNAISAPNTGGNINISNEYFDLVEHEM